MADNAVTALSPQGAAAFQANWDGRGSLQETYARSPLFCSNACMSAWSESQSDLDGLPIPSDLLLHVGAMFASESAGARFSMFGQDG